MNQYVEVVPGVSCNHPSSGPGSGNGGHGGNGGGHLSPSTNQQLSNSGGAGKAVQQLVASSGTGGGAPKHHHHKGAGTGNPATAITQVNASGQSPLSALLHPILTGSGADGLGLILPVGLACILAFMVLIALLRRRRLTS